MKKKIVEAFLAVCLVVGVCVGGYYIYNTPTEVSFKYVSNDHQYYMGDVDKDAFRVVEKYRFKDPKVIDVDSVDKDILSEDITDVTVSAGGYEQVVSIPTIPITAIGVNNTVYEGDPVEVADKQGYVEYQDGYKKAIDMTSAVITEGSDVFSAGENILKVKTADIPEVTCVVKAIKAVNVEPLSEYKEGETLDVYSDKGCITFEDGSTREVALSDLIFISDTDTALKAGENTFVINYCNREISMVVEAEENSMSAEVAKNLEAEIDSAKFSHVSDTAVVTVQEKTLETGGHYYLTHVVVNEASQVKGGLSSDVWGGDREKPTSASERQNWICGTNGSYFSLTSGQLASAGVYIKDGAIFQDGTTNGKEVCLKSDGTLFSPSEGLTGEELISQGVVQVFGTEDPVLIKDGKVQDLSSSNNKTYNRTAYGMVKPCEYYIITAGDANYTNGLTFTDLQDIFSSLGCTYARSLDGGGSSSLVFEGNLINTPSDEEGERPVADFLYFVE